MNSFTGKTILSFLRGGDYAHPGEEEAIQLTFSGFEKMLIGKYSMLGVVLVGQQNLFRMPDGVRYLGLILMLKR